LACGERKWVFGDGAVAEAAFEIMGVTNSEFLAIPATLVRDVPVAKLNGQIGGFIRSAAPEMVLIPVS
jgi:LmbE family N-acetylglucosaminyl deacetylase